MSQSLLVHQVENNPELKLQGFEHDLLSFEKDITRHGDPCYPECIGKILVSLGNINDDMKHQRDPSNIEDDISIIKRQLLYLWAYYMEDIER